MLAIRYDAPRASLEIGGRFPTACGDKPLYLTPLDADTYLDDLFRPLWREMGGSLGGRMRPGDTPASAQLLARWESPPLSEVIREVNKYSNNVMARQIFLALGNSDAPASPERAQARLRTWLDGKHLGMPAWKLIGPRVRSWVPVAAWAVSLEIAGIHAGVVSGAMNMCGNLGGTLSPLVIGAALERWGSWEAPLVSVAVLYGVAAACWLAIDPEDRLAER